MTRKNRDLPTPQPTPINLDLSDVENIFCARCGNFAFVHVTTFKKLSAIMSPTGKEGLVPIDTFMCSDCGYVPPEMMPVPIKVPTATDQTTDDGGFTDPKSSLITQDLS